MQTDYDWILERIKRVIAPRKINWGTKLSVKILLFSGEAKEKILAKALEWQSKK